MAIAKDYIIINGWKYDKTNTGYLELRRNKPISLSVFQSMLNFQSNVIYQFDNKADRDAKWAEIKEQEKITAWLTGAGQFELGRIDAYINNYKTNWIQRQVIGVLKGNDKITADELIYMLSIDNETQIANLITDIDTAHKEIDPTWVQPNRDLSLTRTQSNDINKYVIDDIKNSNLSGANETITWLIDFANKVPIDLLIKHYQTVRTIDPFHTLDRLIEIKVFIDKLKKLKGGTNA